MSPRVFESIAAWAAHPHSGTLGFVPTMGALHDGHAELVRRSVAENDHTVVSIFVNPTQFNDPKDLEKYPRTLTEDLALLERAGADYVILPRPEDLYRDGYRYRVQEQELSRSLEGAHRPGHFDGMLTVVLKLLNLAGADRAYFGEKDFQQLELVREMADAFFLATAIVGCPTVRETDGLAMSSRNRLLTPAGRRLAPHLARLLSSGEPLEDIRTNLQALGFEVDYVEEAMGRILGAVRVDGVRLIDNFPGPGRASRNNAGFERRAGGPL